MTLISLVDGGNRETRAVQLGCSCLSSFLPPDEELQQKSVLHINYVINLKTALCTSGGAKPSHYGVFMEEMLTPLEM